VPAGLKSGREKFKAERVFYTGSSGVAENGDVTGNKDNTEVSPMWAYIIEILSICEHIS
jgi:hypothetical protein